MTEFVTIHGDQWKLADIKESAEWVREQTWEKRQWHPRAALVSSGQTSEFVGQNYDPEKIQLVEDGWTHDHCEICWWSIHESEDPEHGEGFTVDGRSWICSECYGQFVQNDT